ncbi:hypothetical protein DFJ43DRAFT_326992 [Lentinula guzmanii]|uniref:Uncharacterized protein n=1 Tax=Lentinula guzmanii TaxID=2804957 RepID=A0AA38JCG0_9AGAR|nr:hypothetical protein DFJ43DRAFT_326992 [Lentinula guzmanii]
MMISPNSSSPEAYPIYISSKSKIYQPHTIRYRKDTMFVPASNITRNPHVSMAEGDSTLYSTQTSNNHDHQWALVIAVFILIFYALALWDRWIYLKSREIEKLRILQAHKYYGSTLQVPIPAKVKLLIEHHQRRPLISTRPIPSLPLPQPQCPTTNHHVNQCC